MNVVRSNFASTICNMFVFQGVDRNIYSMESSQEMLGKDVVQLYVARYASMRKDVLGTAKDVDFLLWPRGDLLCIRCFVFSRWKVEGKKNGDPYRVVQVKSTGACLLASFWRPRFLGA